MFDFPNLVNYFSQIANSRIINNLKNRDLQDEIRIFIYEYKTGTKNDDDILRFAAVYFRREFIYRLFWNGDDTEKFYKFWAKYEK